MFWRKKTNSFDWHKHVRTTIKLRREARKQKVDVAVDRAVGGIKGASKASVSASVSGLDALNRIITAPISWLGGGIGATLGFAAKVLSRPLEPVGRFTERRGVAPMLGLVAVVAGLLGLGRARVEGWDRIALILFVGSVALSILLVGPALIAGRGPQMLKSFGKKLSDLWRRVPGAKGLSVQSQRAITGGLVVVLLGGAGWFGARAVSGLTGVALPAVPGFSRPAVEGLVSVASGSTLRINNQMVRLTGIDAPEPDQQCGGKGKEPSWRCGAAARDQLRDFVRGKKLRCDLGSGSDKGVTSASCFIGTQDVAAEMVSRGAVFAQSGLFSSYGRQEQEARNARRGLWRGSAERPEEFRSRHWETAKKAAPQGCPIKGKVSRSERVYVMPWSNEYRGVKIRSDKGERWFCSETEAQAAGWRSASAKRDG